MMTAIVVGLVAWNVVLTLCLGGLVSIVAGHSGALEVVTKALMLIGDEVCGKPGSKHRNN